MVPLAPGKHNSVAVRVQNTLNSALAIKKVADTEIATSLNVVVIVM